jgi:phospholipid-binding lipoprotein MlaA
MGQSAVRRALARRARSASPGVALGALLLLAACASDGTAAGREAARPAREGAAEAMPSPAAHAAEDEAAAAVPDPSTGLAASSEEPPPAAPEEDGARHGLLTADVEELDDDWFDEEFVDPADRDSLERFNRGVFTVNEVVYAWLLDPVATVYDFVVPEPGQRAIRRVFANLSQPVIFVNDLLQLAPSHAGASGARFVINTTAGLGGLFDPAAHLGLPGHRTDFGQTLAIYSVRSGAYLVIPVIGPSTVRDAFGVLVDGLFRPDVWLLTLGPVVMIAAGESITTYEVERERFQALRETSVDFYAALRGAYLLDRDAVVEARRSAVRKRGASARAQRRGSSPGSRILSSMDRNSSENPSRRSTEEYSERRSASSLTVPFRKTSTILQEPSRSCIR